MKTSEGYIRKSDGRVMSYRGELWDGMHVFELIEDDWSMAWATEEEVDPMDTLVTFMSYRYDERGEKPPCQCVVSLRLSLWEDKGSFPPTELPMRDDPILGMYDPADMYFKGTVLYRLFVLNEPSELTEHRAKNILLMLPGGFFDAREEGGK